MNCNHFNYLQDTFFRTQVVRDKKKKKSILAAPWVHFPDGLSFLLHDLAGALLHTAALPHSLRGAAPSLRGAPRPRSRQAQPAPPPSSRINFTREGCVGWLGHFFPLVFRGSLSPLVSLSAPCNISRAIRLNKAINAPHLAWPRGSRGRIPPHPHPTNGPTNPWFSACYAGRG